MSSAVETEVNRGRTRGRGEYDDDLDGVPDHLKCAVCLGEGRDVCPPRAREPTKIRVPLHGVQRFRVNSLLVPAWVLVW
jgi:hypothetical protein